MLERGARWRIGDGNHVNLWSDAWLGGKETCKIFTPRRILDNEATMSLL